jgi:hypothetical protein
MMLFAITPVSPSITPLQLPFEVVMAARLPSSSQMETWVVPFTLVGRRSVGGDPAVPGWDPATSGWASGAMEASAPVWWRITSSKTAARSARRRPEPKSATGSAARSSSPCPISRPPKEGGGLVRRRAPR